MIWRKAGLRMAAVLLLAASISLPAAAQEDEPGGGSWAGMSYRASEGYNSVKQGQQFWHYQDWNGATYENMTYNAALDSWQGREEWSRIGFRGPDKMHPGRSDVDSVRAFRVPVSGRIAIESVVSKYDRNGGDGVNVKIMHNETQLWPLSGWQHVPYNEAAGIAANLELDVEKGDYIRFVVNQNINISNDNTSWNPLITYISSEAPDMPVISGAADGVTYREAVAPQWETVDGVVITAILRKAGGPDISYTSGTPIAENGQYELELTATRQSNGLQASTAISFGVNLVVGAGDWAGRSFSSSDAYNMQKQGNGHWYYMDWDGEQYAYMGYQTNTFNAWQGRSAYTLIGWNGAETVHPGNDTDMVRVFRAPVGGEAIVTGNVRKRDRNGGDGVRAKILLNDEQIWPSSGWQTIAYNDGDGYNVSLPVQLEQGDDIRFVLNRNGNITNDSTYWAPVVTYLSSDAPELPVIEGVEEDGVYMSAAPSWLDPAGTTSTAALSKDGGAFSPFTSDTAIAETGDYVLIVTRVREADSQANSASTRVGFSIGRDSKKSYSASEAFPALAQGADYWFYRERDLSGHRDMTYNAQKLAWQSADGQSWIGAETMLPGVASDSERVFQVPVEGNVVITGTINNPDSSAAALPKAAVFVNDIRVWSAAGWLDIAYNSGVGYSVNLPIYVFPGDEIRFVLGSGGAVIEQEVEWAPIVTYSVDPFRQMLHFKRPSHYIGDVHPYYEDGVYYLFYLKPGTFEPLLASSGDMIHWETRTLTHGSPPPAQVYYALGVFKDGATYRSYYGNFSAMKGSESVDLLNWTNAPAEYDIANNMQLYAAGARDPYVFWDPDAASYRMVSTAYRSKSGTGSAATMDVSIALTTSNGADLTDWGTQHDLIRFPNPDAPASPAKDPEVAQMFKIGNRWYLMASIAGQSVHHVGKPTYWIGSPDTPIDQEDWQTKPMHTLDGEDLAAAQVFEAAGKWYMLGWIPQQSQGNAWGGHLSFPREVYQLEDGRLAVRLETAIGAAIRGERQYDSASGPPISAEAGSWQQDGADIQYSGTAFAMAKLPGSYTRFDLEMDISLDGGASRAGLLLDREITGPYGYEIALDRINGVIRVRHDATGSGGWVNFADLQVGPGAFDGTNKLRLIAEGDMLEIFVNDKHALSARISSSLTATGVRLFASGGDAHFANVRIHDLKGKSMTVVDRTPSSDPPPNSKARPGMPVLSDDNGWHDAKGRDGSYNIAMNMWYGDNGTLYKLYENGVLIDTRTLTDAAPAAQQAVTAIRDRPNGTYVYRAELINAFGATESAVHTVEVTDAAPGRPVLSHDNWDGDGDYRVSMNMWWGTNGTVYRLYENDVLIDMQTMQDMSPSAQSVITTVRDKAPGAYHYRAELANYAGVTSSEQLTVTVSR